MKKGFSLVELSIVLVILGLLVGGILASQSLIRASELRSVSAEFTRYETAIFAFRDKYFALPGDMPNATSFWGDQATGTNACASAATADGAPGTCNGNGDGMLIPGTGEMWRSWQHLAMAGLIEGTYSGTQTGWGSNATPGVDVPASKMANAGYMFMQMANTDAEYAWTDITYAFNMLTFGTKTVVWPSGGVLRPGDAWNIDTKMDDGYPGRGKVWGGAATGGCTTTAASATAQYNLTSTNLCTMAKLFR